MRGFCIVCFGFHLPFVFAYFVSCASILGSSASLLRHCHDVARSYFLRSVYFFIVLAICCSCIGHSVSPSALFVSHSSCFLAHVAFLAISWLADLVFDPLQRILPSCRPCRLRIVARRWRILEILRYLPPWVLHIPFIFRG